MNIQVLQDKVGKDTGVFVPIEDWELIKKSYPDIENITDDLPEWEKELINERLNFIKNNPDKLRPGSELLKFLKE